MKRLMLAFRAWLRVMGSSQVADDVERLLSGQGPTAAEALPAPPHEKPEPPRAKPPARSEAVTLLAALQREGRLVDFLLEDLSGYSDEQVGAAARDVQRQCAKALERIFGLQGVVEAEEGATVEVPRGFDPGRYQLTGNVRGDGPLTGALVHHGWQATRIALPQWTGSADGGRIVAPAEVEVS